jgi:hypothetical protein
MQAMQQLFVLQMLFKEKFSFGIELSEVKNN